MIIYFAATRDLRSTCKGNIGERKVPVSHLIPNYKAPMTHCCCRLIIWPFARLPGRRRLDWSCGVSVAEFSVVLGRVYFVRGNEREVEKNMND